MMVPIAVQEVLRPRGAYEYGTKPPDEAPNGAAVLPDEMGYGGWASLAYLGRKSRR